MAVVLLSLPIVGLALLLAVPELDVRWQHQPAHFWLVLTVALLNVVLGFATSEAAGRRGDTRLFLVSLALLGSAGFLGLHALATPGVLLDEPNAGFTVATPIGLLLAAALAALSVARRGEAIELSRRAQRGLRIALLALLAGWAVASLAELPLLDDPIADDVPPFLRVIAPLAIALYAFAAVRYFALYRERRRPLPLAIAVAFVLLAEAMVAIVFGRAWHATWWEWHILMAIGFGAIFYAARIEYRREGTVGEAFGGLYLEQTLSRFDRRTSDALKELTDAIRRDEPIEPVVDKLRAEGMEADRIALLRHSAGELRRVDELLRSYVGPRLAERLTEEPSAADLGGAEVEVSILFADLVGFTTFSEDRPPEEVIDLLNRYWGAVVPTIADRDGGLIERFAGDAVMVVYNALGDQPDHAVRAVRSALFVRQEIEAISSQQVGWPRFRIGVNTGRAVVGNVGASAHRSFAAIGDTTNIAARIQGAASPGAILVGESTYVRLGGVFAARALGPLQLKGKTEPVRVYEVTAG